LLSLYYLTGKQVTGVIPVPVKPGAPFRFALHASQPNPFNPRARIVFEVPRRVEQSQLCIYDALGRRIVILQRGALASGRHEVEWDGKSNSGEQVASGVYYCRFTAGEFEATRKLTLAR
jgi:hypothetical protein